MPQILWKCKPKPRPDGVYVVDWRGSPTFRVTFGAIGQDNSILHLVPVLIGMGMAVPVGSWLLECASSLGPLSCYVIGPQEVVVKYEVVGSRLSADDAMVVQVR